MALPTDTFTTYGAVGIREDLSDMIYNIAPTETPFLSGIAKAKASAVAHEWQTDSLAAASGTNFVLEGDDAVTDAATATVRLANYCCISDKVARVTGTLDAVNKAGRDTELAYQVVKRTKELKRDMETILLANNPKVAGDATTARETAGIGTWIATNDAFASDGGSPSPVDGTDARTDGTQRAFAESHLKTALAAAWSSGGMPDTIMVGAFNKQAISGFTGGATRWDDAEDKRLVSAIDIYVSDFGELKVVPNRFSRSRDALILQMDMWAIAYLRPVRNLELAKTGDSQRRQIIAEYALEARNEAASAGVFDLTTS